MRCRSSHLLAVLALALVAATPATAEEPVLPDWWIGSPPACGDTTVATLSAAECDAVDEELEAEAPLASAETTQLGTLSATAAAPGTAQQTEPADASCRYRANVLFYAGSATAPSDWLRVARTMAEHASPCAQYWIHVATLAANKLACRVNQAHQIRAHGPNFHAMCEAHIQSWAPWVAADPTRTWHAAGVRVREQMASVGFDVTQGDTWSINELSSAVRVGTGNARRNTLEFLRGLFEGGDLPDIQGNVFVVGLAQLTRPTTVYKDRLKAWFEDVEFWREASKYVRFWGQEVYGDVRNTLVPGAPRNVRATYLNDYLQQVAMLAEAGPAEIEVTRAYLRQAHYPLANAAWGWGSGFGFTAVPLETMKQYAAIQEFALRHYLGSHPQSVAPTVGYAWQPRNAFNLSPAEFQRQWGELLEMLAISIAESLGQGGASQVGACGPPGAHVWCDGELDGASFNEEWALLRSWD